MEKKKLVLVDGNSVAYRSFFAMQKQLDKFINHQGLHTNAIYAFKRMFEMIIKNEKPTHMLVAFDASKTTFRHEMFKDYKAGRAKTPSEFREQLPYIRELISAFGVKSIDKLGYEADDIIGTFATDAANKDFEVVIYTGDRDLTQLASENITVKVTIKGVSELEIYTPTHIMEKYGLEPKQIIDMKGLAGDKSDNILGVTKIGEKTAIKLLKEYGTIENLYNHIDELKATKMKENLINDQQQAFLSKELATINCQVPIDIKLDDCLKEEEHLVDLKKLYQELDFKQFLLQLNEDSDSLEIDYPNINYTVVDSVEEKMLPKVGTLIVEILGENYHIEDIIALAWGDETNIYVAQDVYALLEQPIFKKWLEEAKLTVFDVKKTKILLNRVGINLTQKTDDLLIGNYLLNTVKQITEVADVCSYFDEVLVKSDEEIYGKGKSRQVPLDNVLYEHLARKVNATTILMPKILEELTKKEQIHLYEDIEMPFAYILAKMEITGIKVDAHILKDQGQQISQKLIKLEKEIYDEAGVEFNINSPKQLGEVLFEKMQLPVIKKTKTGYSTSVDVLNKLRTQAPIVDKILVYRQLAKLKSSFIEGLLKQIHSDGKIHTRYMQTLTQTGRLSSVDPNLQNIPVRLEEGRNIRKSFIPSKENYVIFSSDYSQIELRVLAAISGDEQLQKAFRNNEDIHDLTARYIFNLKADADVTNNMRRQAKAVNFGVVYGISDYGLSENLDISRKEASKFIDAYLTEYSGVKKYMEEVVREAKDKGYVETLFKRRRYLPDINARQFNLRSFAERTAINSPIQGSAADILKIAMIKMTDKLAKTSIRANLLLQVHDEVIFEVHQDDEKELQQLVEEVMSTAVKLSVPLVTDSSFGKSWFDAK